MDAAVFSSVATQLMISDKRRAGSERFPIRRPKFVSFSIEGHRAEHRKAQPLSHAVVKFKDVKRNKFIAVAVDGDVKEFGALAKRKRSGTE